MFERLLIFIVVFMVTVNVVMWSWVPVAGADGVVSGGGEIEVEVGVSSQALVVSLSPDEHHVLVRARYEVEGSGPMTFALHPRAVVRAVFADDAELLFTREKGEGSDGALRVNLTGEESTISILYEAHFQQDVDAGEQPGQIHNHAVSAHIGPGGVFLAEGSDWHPRWVDADGVPHLVPTTIRIDPIEGWTFIASGDPIVSSADREDEKQGQSFDVTAEAWRTPRAAPGVTLVGRRGLFSSGVVHETVAGPVELVVSFSESNMAHAQAFLSAARSYLDVYAPLLGPFPYRRFTIVENFFSSGFAYPGFTLLGPRVVAMGERALGPGYLDHELVHNWFGNGVYVDPRSGNWCEGLTTYCTNYYRRARADGEDAAFEYRRDVLMRLSVDPASFDNGPPARFGVDPSINRFVGYEKAAFVFIMLEQGPGIPGFEIDRTPLFEVLRVFSREHMGTYATWEDLARTVENVWEEDRSGFFRHWVEEHHVPITPSQVTRGEVASFIRQFSGDEPIDIQPGSDEAGRFVVIDPDFLVYRALPPDQIIPTLAGTLGPGGVRVVASGEAVAHPEVASFVDRAGSSDDGENLFLIGRDAIEAHAALLGRVSNPISLTESGFALGDGTTFEGPDDALLHTMQHPDHAGRFVTVFVSNGAAEWSRLRLVSFYTRDSTIVWRDGAVTHRATFEPSRKLRRIEE